MVENSRFARYLSEFIGTYFLVFTVGLNVLAGNPVWGVTSIACMLMISIYALGACSGANFNPAVSFALGLSGALSWLEVAIYVAVQLVAGILAGFSYGAVLWKVMSLEPGKGFGWWEAGLAETFYTFMLCFVVLNCAVSAKNNPPSNPNQFYGIAIGFVIVAGGYAAGPVSGGAFNPAVALGIDIPSIGIGFGWAPVYIGFELLGAALAAALFRVLRPDDFGEPRGSPHHHHLLPFQPPPEYGLARRCLSEFLGTFMLVLTVGLNVIGGSPAGAWSIAAAVMCMIFALHDVSGAHFNPAVTLSIVASGRKKFPAPTEADTRPSIIVHAAAYVGSQLIGGVAAGGMYVLMHHGNGFALEPNEGLSWPVALTVEIVYTFVLCFVFLSVATVERPLCQFFGVAIGCCITAGGFAIGNISGGSMNPAVSFGISAGGGLAKIYTCLIYSAAEIAGGISAAGVFYVVHRSEFPKGAAGKRGELLGVLAA